MTEITLDTAETIASYVDAELRADYSGRYMYGSECFGLVPEDDSTNGFALAVALAGAKDCYSNDDEIVDAIMAMTENAPTTDSMGRGTIFYWRNIKVVD